MCHLTAGGAEKEKPGRVVGGRRVGGASRAAAGVKSRGASSITQRQADKRSLGAQFKQQLTELVKLIESGRAHYVRCIKPNSFRKAHTFEAGNVLRQLRCSGVTETVRARRAGWPVNHSFGDFVQRYSEVYLRSKKGAKMPAAEDVLPILEFFLKDPDAWRIGKNKVCVSGEVWWEMGGKSTDVEPEASIPGPRGLSVREKNPCLLQNR